MKYPVFCTPGYCMMVIFLRSVLLFEMNSYDFEARHESGYTCVDEVSLYSILLHWTIYMVSYQIRV